MQVIIGVDGSLTSFDDVAQVCDMLHPDKDRLTFYYSLPDIRRKFASDHDVVNRGLAELGELILARAEVHLPGVWRSHVERHVGTGNPSSGILETAKQMSADLIIVGTRGLAGIGRLMVGSVSRKVVHGANIPVLVARKRPHGKDAFGRRVVLACESISTGKELSSVLNRFTWRSDAICEIVHVVESLFGGPIPEWLDAEARKPDVEELVKLWVRHHDERIAAAKQEMETLDHELPPRVRLLPPTIVEGSPGEEIIKVAHRQESDLIVIGAKASTAIGRAVSGSTCESVLNHAPCSVLVVPHAGT